MQKCHGLAYIFLKKGNGFPTDIDVFAHKISLLFKKKNFTPFHGILPSKEIQLIV